MSSEHNPPAFPMSGEPGVEFDRGMSLLDWFAGMAMNQVMRDWQNNRQMASNCYRMAEAMLAERAERMAKEAQ